MNNFLKKEKEIKVNDIKIKKIKNKKYFIFNLYYI